MKNTKRLFSIVALLLMFTVSFADTGGSPCVAQEQIGVEVKEGYKIDDAEYTVALVSKSKIGGHLGFGSEGITLLGGMALLVSLFKRNPLQTFISLLALSIYIYAPQYGAETLAMFPLVTKFYKPGDANEDEGGITQEKLNDALEAMGKKTSEAIATQIDKATKGKIGMTEFTAALTEAGIEKGTITKLENILKEQGVELAKLKQKGNKRHKERMKDVVNAAFENEDFLKSAKMVAKTKSGLSIEAWEEPDVNKVAATTMTTGAVTTDSGGNALFDMLNADEIGDLNLQEPFVEQYCTVSRTSRPVFAYADPYPKNGDAGFTAENAPKSQLDYEWKVKTLGPKKVTAYEVLTEESVTDIPQMQSVANNILLKKVLLKRQNGILFGDGTGNQPIGVKSLSSAFDPASWSANGNDKVISPNLYDAIVAGANMIQNKSNYTEENEYFPNVVFINPKDFAALKLKKNEFGMYLFPQFVIGPNKDQRIENLAVVSRRQITAGRIMIGDFTKLRIINYVDYNLRMGYINDQLINNLFTMVGESRFFTLIKILDQIAFVEDSIQNIYDGIQAA